MNKKVRIKEIKQFIDDTSFEGESGVRNLAKLAGKLGYTDFQKFGYFSGGCFGDLIVFFEDNPGAMMAVVEWIEEQYCSDKENLDFPDECDEDYE